MSNDNAGLASPETLSFERALKELEEIVAKLDHGDVALEEAVAFYERGEKLKKRCVELLDIANAKIETLKLNHDSTIAKDQHDEDDEIFPPW